MTSKTTRQSGLLPLLPAISERSSVSSTTLIFRFVFFMNDGSREQSPLSSYGSANIAKLKTVSLEYDSPQLFQNLQNDGFLLSKIKFNCFLARLSFDLGGRPLIAHSSMLQCQEAASEIISSVFLFELMQEITNLSRLRLKRRRRLKDCTSE